MHHAGIFCFESESDRSGLCQSIAALQVALCPVLSGLLNLVLGVVLYAAQSAAPIAILLFCSRWFPESVSASRNTPKMGKISFMFRDLPHKRAVAH